MECDGRVVTLVFEMAGSQPLVPRLTLLSDRIRQVSGVQSVSIQVDRNCVQKLIIISGTGGDQVGLLRRMADALRASDESLSAESGPLADSAVVFPAVTAVAAGSPGLIIESVQATSAISHLMTDTQSVAGRDHAGFEEGPSGSRLRQLFYGTLAVGSFGMTWVGIIVPGIPTVPFLILTATLAAKSSPALHRRLRRARVFGPMIRDWEMYRAVRPQVRIQGAIATLVIVGISVVLAPPSPGMYLLIGTMAAIGLFMISRIPVLSEDGSAPQTPRAPARTAVISTVTRLRLEVRTAPATI
jgi:uncharacterized membrane protein YbaN (DUF454 family)